MPWRRKKNFFPKLRFPLNIYIHKCLTISSQSSTSSLESLNESSTKKYGLLSHTCTNQLFRTKTICYDTAARYCSDDNSDEELNARIGNTNWCIYMW